jgi:large subunit ribosomal protein L14e
MVFRKYVEIGRVVFVNYGPLAGKLAVIVDILNTSKLLISGPTSGVRRQEISLNRVSLTDFKIDVVRGIKEAQLKSAIESFGLEKKWGESSWARKIHRATRRAQLTDFDRFKVKVLKQKRRVLLNTALKQK